MRICIDSIGVSNLSGTGLGTFTFEFLKNLLYMYPQPEYHLLYDSENFDFKVNRNSKVFPLNLQINRLNNDYSSIENHIIKNKIDIYHSPNNGFSIPENKKCHYISTVVNLLPVVNKNFVDDKYLEKFNRVFNNVVKNSDKIIVVSEFLREQLKNYFDIPDKKIVVNYPGCSAIFKPKNEESCVNILKSKYKINGDYILHAGSIHIRKNLEKLIKAFKYVNLYNKNLKLVFVGSCKGKREAYYKKLRLLIEDMDLIDSVIFTGEVDYNDMPYFYSKAKCVINLSKYEGFPLTSLEAMACNTPVIWNDVSFFKEVFGDSGLPVDANDHNMLVDEISDIINNTSKREQIINKQSEVTYKYKWEKNIINTIRVYETFC
ncbi:glycosyltransferase family 4 protein [Clostridium sp. SYSU_GA19001]|uniref:glycosyltransferase family 4 protein n=1 Tax=Clostridium caldaquaticum TaxID=2940653 RepID=UPI002076E65B|nr:glycosyltransferase family 1 protein [Clostridium caldaquaticum]MCM8709602.1 glycosyltransferase family 4 protein [Clostridium caldaquaticum]